MDEGNSTLNISSLIDLKAELHKKYEAFRNLKTKLNITQLPKCTPLKNKGETLKEKKKPKESIVKPKETNNEEDLALKKSRLALEAKTKLYEKIVSNNILIDDEQKDLYLVDFQRKVLYRSEEPKLAKEPEIIETANFSPKNNTEQGNFFKTQRTSVKHGDENPDLEDPEQPIHYQNVQFNEVRDHGTGYFAFSMNETKRKEQMEELNSMRQETEEERLKRQRLQRKRKMKLQTRLAKICERKNIDQSVLKSYSVDIDKNDIEFPEEEKIDITSIPLPDITSASENKQETEKKKPKVRPWDIGKDNVHFFISERKIKSQSQWVEEKREQRPVEFAPPTSY